MNEYLILSPALDQAQSLAHYIRKYQPASRVIGLDETEAGSLRTCGYYHRIARPSDSMLDSRHAVVCPTGAASTHQSLLGGDIALGSAVMTPHALRAYDKPAMLREAGRAGIPVPETWLDAEDISRFPVFYKQNRECGGRARGIATTREELPAESLDRLLFQEVIAGKGTYGVGFIARAGEVLVCHAHHEVESYPKTGGSAVVVDQFQDFRIVEYTARLLRYLEFTGWGLVEFKYCPDRSDYVFMELNAKLWASLDLAFANEPGFLSTFFNIASREKHTHRMIYLDRAFARGWRFVLLELPRYLRRARVRVYPGWLRRAVINLMPRVLRKVAKTLLQRGSV